MLAEGERERRQKMSILSRLLFPPPPSLFVTAMSVMSLVASSYGGLSEVGGKHLRYSKFTNSNSPNNIGKEIKLPSRIGMLVAYTPALVTGLASLGILDTGGPRCLLLSSALGAHFFKRVVEVMCFAIWLHFHT